VIASFEKDLGDQRSVNTGLMEWSALRLFSMGKFDILTFLKIQATHYT
jgi:hypothetical protein